MKGMLVVVVTSLSVALVNTAALAGVNCNQVRKYLETGRTPQDIADTMVISVDDVKKCQAGGDAKGDGKDSPGAPSSAAPASTGTGPASPKQ
jgi:hypothetical protein